MIRGFCLGGGLLTALQADIRIASDDSQFGIPAARLGLGPGFASVTTLVDLVGPAWASEILFSARRFPAAEALRMGLVNRVVPAADLRDEVMSLARDIAQNAPLTVAACKAAIREAGRSPDRRDLARVESMIEACFAVGGLPRGPARLRREAPARLHRALTPRRGPPAPGRARPGGHFAVFAEVWCGGRPVQPCRPPPSGTLPGPPVD